METIILVLLMGGMNLLAFLIGAKTGQKIVNKEPVELPTINPLEIYREHKERVETSKAQETLNANLENINNYSGDGTGQKDIK